MTVKMQIKNELNYIGELHDLFNVLLKIISEYYLTVIFFTASLLQYSTYIF